MSWKYTLRPSSVGVARTSNQVSSGRVVLLEAHGPPALERLLVAALRLGADELGVDVPDPLADELVAAAAEDPLGGGVDVGERPRAVDGQERRARRLQHAPEPLGVALHAGRVVGGAEHPHGPPVRVAEHAPARRDPADRPVVMHDAVVRLVLAAAVDGARDRGLDARPVVGVHALRERVDVLVERVARVAEQLVQPVVPVQRVGGQVPVEAADVRRREPEVEPHRAGLELRRQRAALELGGDRCRTARAGRRRRARSRRTARRRRRTARRRARRRPRSARRGTSRRRRRRAPRRARAAPAAASVRSHSSSARGWRGATGVTGTCSSVRSVTCAWAAPSSRALSAASRSSASPGASASRRRAASIRCGSSRPARTASESILGSSLSRLLRSAHGKRERLGADEPLERPDHGPDRLQPQPRVGVDRLHARLGEQLGAAVAERLRPSGRTRPGRCPARPRPRTPPARRAPGSRARASRSARTGRRRARARTPRAP